MKIDQIYVGAEGAQVNVKLNSGARPTAIFPIQKGGKHSSFLLDSGKVAHVKGARINGIGIKRWLTEQGMVLANAGNKFAERLADYLDIQEGIKLVEDGQTQRAHQIQSAQAGKALHIIPFARDKEERTMAVDGDSRFSTHILGIGTGISGACVRADNSAYRAGSGGTYSADACLLDGWVIPEGEVPSDFPRPSEYGELLETAAYIICNAGLAKLGARKHIEGDEPGIERGSMVLDLPEGESIIVGVDAADELVVRYLDAFGQCVYERHGLEDVRLGEAVGSIAAVIVRVAEIRAAQAKPAKRSKKVAA